MWSLPSNEGGCSGAGGFPQLPAVGGDFFPWTVIGNGTKTEEEAVLVTQHLCKVRGLLFDTVSFKDSAEGVCRDVKKAFQGAHIYITSDNDDDVRTAHRQFFRWKK